MRPLTMLLALLCLPASAGDGLTGWSLGGPVAPDGTPVQCLLDPSLHMRNTGGMGVRGPGTGSGLCVFTSCELAGRWHNIPELDGFQRWMMSRPGGGDPRKLDAMLKAFCAQKGVEVPRYIQIEGSRDLEILRLACRTGRYPCIRVVALPGYRGHIDHMVNLALAGAPGRPWACQDNNEPGRWSHLTEAEFQKAYGNWAVIFLAPGQPPAPKEP